MNQLVFVLGKENFDKFVSNEQNKKHFIKDVFQPDIYVENTLEDYEKGIDRQLEVAKDVISREHLQQTEEKEKRIQAFISKLKADEMDEVSFEDNLELFFEANHVREPIKQLIYSSLEEQ